MLKAKTALKDMVLGPRGSRTRDVRRHRLATLTDLPLEVLLHIGNELLRDPGTTLLDFKTLRLVCRSLDSVFAPIVLSSIHAFFYSTPRGKTLARCHQLHALTAGYDRLSYVKELTLHSWDWIFLSFPRQVDPSKQASGLKAKVKSRLWQYVLRPAGYVLWTLYIDPTSLVRQIRKISARSRAKRYVRQAESVTFKLSNVQSVSWWLRSGQHPESHQSMLLNLRVLEALPSLTELEIALDSSYDGLEDIAISMSRLHNLRKLTVRIYVSNTEMHELDLKWLRQAIASNPHLTHLDIYQCGELHYTKQQAFLPFLFEDVPQDAPLKLEHLRISPQYFEITSTLSPHLRCLTSLDVSFPASWEPNPMDTIWHVLYEEGIFVSELQTSRVTEDMLQYLSHLQNLTSLAIYDSPLVGQARNQEPAKSIFPALVRHSNTLRRLKLEPYNWGYWFKDPDVQASLMRYTNLEEFILHQADKKLMRGVGREIPEIAHVISQLDSPLTFIVEGEILLYTLFVRHCREDSRPPLQNLCGRIAYQQGKW